MTRKHVKEDKKKKNSFAIVSEDLCCVCKKSAVLHLPFPGIPELRVGLCDKHYESYNDLTKEERKAFKEKHFNKEIKEIEECPPDKTLMLVEFQPKSAVDQLLKLTKE